MHKLTNFRHQYLLNYLKSLLLVERKVSRFLSSLHSFLFQNFTTNPSKVRNGHFWTKLIKFRVFLIF